MYFLLNFLNFLVKNFTGNKIVNFFKKNIKNNFYLKKQKIKLKIDSKLINYFYIFF